MQKLFIVWTCYLLVISLYTKCSHIMVLLSAPQIKTTCSFQAMTRYTDTFIARHLDRGGTIEGMKTFYESFQMEQNWKTVKVDLMWESCLEPCWFFHGRIYSDIQLWYFYRAKYIRILICPISMVTNIFGYSFVQKFDIRPSPIQRATLYSTNLFLCNLSCSNNQTTVPPFFNKIYISGDLMFQATPCLWHSLSWYWTICACHMDLEVRCAQSKTLFLL